jgi:hypothetical protein
MNANEHAFDFAVSRLDPLLVELGCTATEQSRAIAWFWQASKSWTTESREAFVAEARQRLALHVGKRLPAPTPKPAPPASIPDDDESYQPWTPCKHFGGTRECSRCKAKKTAAGRKHVSAMRLADDMYRDHEMFVKSRIHAELQPYTGGKPFSSFDDLEQVVWRGIASRIETYNPQASPTTGKEMQLTWLRRVVHSVVIDYFKREYAAKRGNNKTVSLGDFDPSNEAAFATPKRPAGAPPDEEDSGPSK